MKTAYRILVRIEIEGEEPPAIEDVESEVADLIRDPDDHNLRVEILAGLIE